MLKHFQTVEPFSSYHCALVVLGGWIQKLNMFKHLKTKCFNFFRLLKHVQPWPGIFVLFESGR